jgi:hypothetical protein
MKTVAGEIQNDFGADFDFEKKEKMKFLVTKLV